ncbi:MAG TPA: hypothetical protein VGQ69_08735 [Gemmatimonadales bacterium]|nr:hypothetical protein [Gemmatimonadales bacterium]
MPARPLLAVLLLVTSASGLLAQRPPLQRLIERGRHPAIRWGDFSDVQSAAQTLYRDNGWQPLWMARGRPTRSARALLDALATVGDRGLRPEDYDASQLSALAATLERGGADVEQAVRFDAALSIGALRLVRALALGRISAREASVRFSTARARFDPVATVRELRGSLEPGPLLTELEPSWPQYLVLKRALSRYRALLRDSLSWRLPRPRTSGLREGDRYAGAARLRRLLATLGDLAPEAAAPRNGDSTFSSELADGVRRFQIRQGAGTHVDGALHEASWRLLSSQFPRRIRQMELALERWRWLPRELETAGEPLVVSLPAMRLHYVARAAEPLPVGMRVSLGSGFERARPVQAEVVVLLVFRPPDRALGTVWFPTSGNPWLALHGSTAAESYDEVAGCIRVADAELLATILLRDRFDWPLERIHAAMVGTKPVFVRLRRNLPLLVLYGTAVARENGQVFFYEDGFGQDQRLERQLARGYPYARW